MNDIERLPEALPYRSFRDNTVDVRGGLMQAYELSGPSPETSDDIAINARAEQLASAFKHLGTGDCVHVLYHRLPASVPPAGTFTNQAAALVDQERRAQFEAEGHWITPTRLYLSHRFEKPARGFIQAMLLSASGPQRLERNELLREQALQRFAAFEDSAASGIGLRRLSDEETFRDLLLATVGHDYPALLPTNEVRLNEVIGCERFIGGLQPFVNGFYLRPVCITAYPTHTVPQLLGVLLKRPGRMMTSARFICYDAYDAIELLRAERKHWNREILGSLWKVIKGWFNRDQKTDADTQAQLDNIDLAIAASAAGMTFGHATVTAIVRDHDADHALLRARDIVKDLHAHGMMGRVEDINSMEAIMGSWPGNTEHNIRRPIISGANFADATLPVTRWLGIP